MSELPGNKTKADFQPEVEVTDHTVWFKYDTVYYGIGKVGDVDVYYDWKEDVLVELGPWRRVFYRRSSNDVNRVSVDRQRLGFGVYIVHKLTDEQKRLLALNAEIRERFPQVERDEHGAVFDIEDFHKRNDELRAMQKEEGCDFEALKKAVETFPPENFVGYFFRDGLNFSEENFWDGTIDELKQESKEIYDFINNPDNFSNSFELNTGE